MTKAATATFIVFLVVVSSGYSPPQPLVSPLPYLRGIAGISNTGQVVEIGANSWYNWQPMDSRDDGRFIPMIRDSAQWTQIRAAIITIDPDVLLGFNEPDVCPDQACLTPQQALGMERWRLTHYTRTLHVSPAPSQESIYWLPQLRNLYISTYGEPPNWDYLAAHCYFYDASTLSLCKSKLNTYISWANAWGIQGVVVTEFGSFAITYHPDDPYDYDGAVARGEDFIDWMESKPEIKGYLWYSTSDWGAWPWYMTTALYSGEELTPLGEMYQEALE